MSSVKRSLKLDISTSKRRQFLGVFHTVVGLSACNCEPSRSRERRASGLRTTTTAAARCSRKSTYAGCCRDVYLMACSIVPGPRSKLKSSAQRAVRARVCETYPLLAPHIDAIIPKKEQLDVVKLSAARPLHLSKGVSLTACRRPGPTAQRSTPSTASPCSTSTWTTCRFHTCALRTSTRPASRRYESTAGPCASC